MFDKRTVASLVLLAIGGAQAGHAQQLLSGSVTLEGRGFPHAGVQASQGGSGVSLTFEPELYVPLNQGGRDRFVLAPYGRVDSEDGARTHFDVREAYWLHLGSTWEFRAGLGRVFWGVTESQHLVDVINQTDLVDNVDGEDKLGQPMIQLTLIQDFGLIDVFLLPRFRERTFPGRRGRLRALEVDTDSARVDRTLGFAMRWSHFVSVFDFGLTYFYGTDREPTFEVVTRSDGMALVPIYSKVHRVGLDAQATVGAWLLKLEALYGDPAGQDVFAATVVGFEYTFGNVNGKGLDIGVLSEYHRDGRGAGATMFDNDVFVGTRLALNDAKDSDLLVGVVSDLGGDGYAGFAEMSRRVGSHWSVAVEARAFLGSTDGDVLHAFRQDDFAQMTLGFHF